MSADQLSMSCASTLFPSPPHFFPATATLALHSLIRIEFTRTHSHRCSRLSICISVLALHTKYFTTSQTELRSALVADYYPNIAWWSPRRWIDRLSRLIRPYAFCVEMISKASAHRVLLFACRCRVVVVLVANF